ncbi:MAG: hypothetical protein ACYSUL_13895 [Planctomycetota bacterium]|jgi:hypothetical protein
MKKIVPASFLIFFLFQLNVFAKQPLNSEDLSKQIKEVNNHLTAISIKLSESIIEETNRPTDLGTLLSLKSIHSIIAKYRDFLEYESLVILMYPYVSEIVKLYFSGMLRDNLMQKKEEFDWSLLSITIYEPNIKNSDIILTLTQLRKRIEESQILIDQLISYYTFEYEKYRQDER